MIKNLHFVRLFLSLLVVSILSLTGCATSGPKPTGPAAQQATIHQARKKPADDNTKPYPDLWSRIRAGYALPALDSPRISKHEEWFASNPEYVFRMSRRARLYLFYITTEVEKRGMPMEIALLPAIESAFRPHARSRARAVGIWQFIRSTGKRFGMKINWWRDGRRDIIAATKGALDYLQKLHTYFDGDWHLALAAYNAGERRVQRAIAYNRTHGLPTDYQSLRLKSETLNYVPKLIALTKIIKDPEKYDVELTPIANNPYFDFIELGSQIDLGIIARKANIPIGELYDLNPGHKRWATDPNGPHYLLVPINKVDVVLDVLEKLPNNRRVVWRRHRIRQGQTLGQIARLYGVSTMSIKRANRIRGHIIRAGRSLMIPASNRRIRRTVSRIHKPRKPKPVIIPKNRVAIVHIVKAGDTLWSIARKYNVYIGQIARWNGLRSRRFLRLGQKIRVWVLPRQVPAAAAAKARSG